VVVFCLPDNFSARFVFGSLCHTLKQSKEHDRSGSREWARSNAGRVGPSQTETVRVARFTAGMVSREQFSFPCSSLSFVRGSWSLLRPLSFVLRHAAVRVTKGQGPVDGPRDGEPGPRPAHYMDLKTAP
jgi:hypothetical protein